MTELRAALRDGSWHRTNGWAAKYHVVTGRNRDGAVLAACSPEPAGRWPRMVLVEWTEQAACDVPEIQRCHRPGCRQRWPSSSRPSLDRRTT